MNTPAPALSLRKPALAFVALLAFGMLTDLFAVVVGVDHLGVINALAGGQDLAFAEVQDADNRLAIAGGLQLLGLVVIGVGGLVWFRRAYRNLPALGARDLRYKPGWAVGAWFVPILNLFRPKQIANDIWRATDPQLPAAPGTGWRDRPVAGLLHWWWALWLGTNFVGNAAARLFLSAETLSEQQTMEQVTIAADALSVVAGFVGILVVRALTDRQEARIDQVRHADPGQPPPVADHAGFFLAPEAALASVPPPGLR